MTHDGLDGLDDIPDDLPEEDRRRLLGDLDSLRDLLGDRRPPPEPLSPGAAGSHVTIPILLEAVGPPAAGRQPVAPPSPPPREQTPVPPPATPVAGGTPTRPSPRRPATPRPAADEFQASLFGDDPLPEPAPRATAPPTRVPDMPPRTGQDNPYLPKAIKDRLAQSQAKATRELRSLLDSERSGPLDRRSSATWQQAHQRVRSRAAVILQQVINDNLPRLEQELRQRLQQELEKALRELGIDGEPPPP